MLYSGLILREEIHSNFSFMNCILLRRVNQVNIPITQSSWFYKYRSNHCIIPLRFGRQGEQMGALGSEYLLCLCLWPKSFVSFASIYESVAGWLASLQVRWNFRPFTVLNSSLIEHPYRLCSVLFCESFLKAHRRAHFRPFNDFTNTEFSVLISSLLEILEWFLYSALHTE